MAATTTVRVSESTRKRIQRLSIARGMSAPALLEDLTKRAEESLLLEAMNAAFAAEQADPTTRRARDAELAEWDTTLLDGLEDLA